MQNAIHMLCSVSDDICDSFIITTSDGRVIVIDGGYKVETPYFLEYLRRVTGCEKPHIDAWFLSHAHDDHVEVFLEIAKNQPDAVSFDRVYVNFPDSPSFYDGYDEWSFNIVKRYNALLPCFENKVRRLSEGDVFSVGEAKFTVLYTLNPEWHDCNNGSTVMRMDLGGTSVMFTGDAAELAGNYVVEKYSGTGVLDCDYCKMAHHGQAGVGRIFYEAVSPDVCLWSTPAWVYNRSQKRLKTHLTRAWVKELGVKKEYKSFEGTAVIPLIPRIVTTTDVFEEGYPAEKAVRRLAGLGFEGIDMGFDYWVFDSSPFLSDGYLDWARSLKAVADETGIAFTHAHAPAQADSVDLTLRSIRAAAQLGARYLAVHPVFRDENGEVIESAERFFQVNEQAFGRLLPAAAENRVNLLAENLLWGASSDPRVIAELVKRVNSPWLGWCFDTGHAHCCGFKPDILGECAEAPLSVHIQDNDGTCDAHLIPGDGTIDWELLVSALKNRGYLGDCVLEAHHQSLEAPDSERDAILKRLLDTAVTLREKMKWHGVNGGII